MLRSFIFVSSSGLFFLSFVHVHALCGLGFLFSGACGVYVWFSEYIFFCVGGSVLNVFFFLGIGVDSGSCFFALFRWGLLRQHAYMRGITYLPLLHSERPRIISMRCEFLSFLFPLFLFSVLGSGSGRLSIPT
jgi:hypothetical protein